jgi:hypothetical protein
MNFANISLSLNGHRLINREDFRHDAECLFRNARA